MTPISPDRVRQILIRLYNSRCQYCLNEYSTGLEVEHIIPRSKGGTDSLENYTIACSSCNSRKRALELSDPGKSLLIALATARVQKVLAIIEPKLPKPQTARPSKLVAEPIFGPPLWTDFREANTSWCFPVPVLKEAIDVYHFAVSHSKTFFWKCPSVSSRAPKREDIRFSGDGYFGVAGDRIAAAMEWWGGVYRGVWDADWSGVQRGCLEGGYSIDRKTGEVYWSFTGRLVSRSFLEYVSSLANVDVPPETPVIVRPECERPKPSRNILNEIMDGLEQYWKEQECEQATTNQGSPRKKRSLLGAGIGRPSSRRPSR